jgi:hypothetical protein
MVVVLLLFRGACVVAGVTLPLPVGMAAEAHLGVGVVT